MKKVKKIIVQHKPIFDKLDVNKDGTISMDEFLNN